MKNKETNDKREYKRYQAPECVFVGIRSGEEITPAFLIDLCMKGASFEYILVEESLPEPDRIDITFEKKAFSIENIPCRLVFAADAENSQPEPVNWQRVGVKFGVLSKKQQNDITYLIHQYWGYPAQVPPLVSSAKNASDRSVWYDDIFLSRLKLLVIGAKAYFKGYPFGEYRKEAISRNADEIIQQLEHQTILKFGESHSLHLKEQILLLSKAFHKIPMKSYGKVDVENSLAYICDELSVNFTQMEFLRVA